MTDELWRPIPGFENYEASNFGSIRSWRSNNGLSRRAKPRILRCGLNDGYRVVTLSLLDLRFSRKVANLVALTWIGPRPDGLLVCHANGNRQDDRVTNLGYRDNTANMADKVRHGTHFFGVTHPSAKLNDAKVRAIRDSSETHPTLAARYGVSLCTIEKVRSRALWKHVV